MKTYSRFIPCDTGKQINVECNCLCLFSIELPFSDIYLKLWSTKKINCNWAYKIDHIYKLTTVTIINLYFTSQGRRILDQIFLQRRLVLCCLMFPAVLYLHTFFYIYLFIYCICINYSSSFLQSITETLF